ncbi:MAG: CPBP family intramembrane metalloprotease [Fibrobacteres bacterium]|nr:CPBP family intramembrane metalloprotease [Fibrobacterota bacterium]
MEVTPDFGLLPRDRSFAQSLPAFLLPYLAYVALASLPHRFLPPAAAEALRFAVVGSLMLAYRRAYRLGPPLTVRPALAALGTALCALALWAILYRLTLALPLPLFRSQLDSAAATDPGPLYAAFRGLNSVLLVPFFEELFCRAFLGELLAGMPSRPGGFLARLALRMDEHPGPLSRPPAQGRAAWGCALVFTLGHGLAAWPAAFAYFALTTVLYRQTRSFRACVAVHGLANLGIAILVSLAPGMRFLWY